MVIFSIVTSSPKKINKNKCFLGVEATILKILKNEKNFFSGFVHDSGQPGLGAKLPKVDYMG